MAVVDTCRWFVSTGGRLSYDGRSLTTTTTNNNPAPTKAASARFSSEEPHKASVMTKSSRPRPSRAVPSSFAPPVHFTSQFNAFGAIERGQGAFQVRCLLQWLTKPRTFVFMTLCLLLVPPLWFSSRRSAQAPAAPAFPVELRKGRRAQLRAPTGSGIETSSSSTPEELVPPPAVGAKKIRESAAAIDERPTAAWVTPVPPHRAPGNEGGREDRRHGGRKGETKPSTRPAVLPVEVFRDVPPEECLRSPLWEKKVDPSDYEFGCDEINVSRSQLARAESWCIVFHPSLNVVGLIVPPFCWG